MKTTKSILSATGAIAAILSTSMSTSFAADKQAKAHGDMQYTSGMNNASQQPSSQQFSRLVTAVRPLSGDEQKVKGTVLFDRQPDDSVKVTAQIGGLESEKQYVISIHQFGDLGSPDASNVGERFDGGSAKMSDGSVNSTASSDQASTESNPSNQATANTTGETTSGIPTQSGDLGVVTADSNGNGKLETTVRNLHLSAGTQGILGRAVVIHQKSNESRAAADQARVAAGVIGISKDGMDPAIGWKEGSQQKNMDRDAASSSGLSTDQGPASDATGTPSRRTDTAIEDTSSPQGSASDPTR